MQSTSKSKSESKKEFEIIEDKLLDRLLSDIDRCKKYTVKLNNGFAEINIIIDKSLDIDYKIDKSLFEKISDKLIKGDNTNENSLNQNERVCSS